MAVKDWNTNPDLNGVVEGQDVAEGSLPPELNDVVRAVAAALKTAWQYSYASNELGGKQHITISASGGAAPLAPVDGDIWMEYTP
jgi:hypothetical protein